MNEETSPLKQAFESALEEHGVKDFSESESTEQAPEPKSEPVEQSAEPVQAETSERADTPEQPAKQEAKPDSSQEKEPAPQVSEEPAPQFWKEQDRQLWSKVPAEVRPILKKYEDMRNKAVTQYKQAINDKIGQWSDASFDEVFPPERVRALRLEGKTPAQVTKSLWEWNDYLEEDPQGAILEIMSRYELTPEALSQSGRQFQQPQQPLQDPRVDMLLRQQQEAQQAQEKNQIKQQLEAFGQEPGNDGKPLRPYWNQVKQVVGRLLPLVYQENPDITDYEALQQAYERAVYVDPQVRTKLVSTQQNAVKFSDEKTLKAKEAASSLTGNSSSSTEPPKTPRSAREALEMAWKIHSR